MISRAGLSGSESVGPGAGRGLNPRPAQEPAQDRLKILIFFPFFVGWVFRGAEDAAEEVDFRFVRFGAQY